MMHMKLFSLVFYRFLVFWGMFLAFYKIIRIIRKYLRINMKIIRKFANNKKRE